MDKKRLIRALLKWFGEAARDLPWRRTGDPYAIWVSEVMLQQTQVKTVLPYWERWMRALPSIEALAKARAQTIHKLWEGLGYYTRVRNMHKAAQVILKNHDGKFPQEFEAVLALPGIGRYTAGAICSIAFNQPTPILDGNVIRVVSRVFGIEGDPRGKETNRKLWALAGDLAREAASTVHRSRNQAGKRTTNSVSHFNQSLMELGALICTPRQPRCGVCPVAKACVARREGRVDELPNLPRRTPVTPRRFVAFIAHKGGRFLVRQRPAGVVNAHLWEFPNVEIGPNGFDAKRLALTVLGMNPKAAAPFCVIKHSITRYRITVEAFRVSGTIPRRNGSPQSRWMHGSQMHRLPFASAHRKILDRLRSQSSKKNPPARNRAGGSLKNQGTI